MQTYNEGTFPLSAVTFSGQGITSPYKNVTLSGDFSFKFSTTGNGDHVSTISTGSGLSRGL